MFQPEDLVTLYKKNTGKLKPRWRSPYRINGYERVHGRFFTLNGTDEVFEVHFTGTT